LKDEAMRRENTVFEKFKLVQEISREVFEMYELPEIEILVELIKKRKKLSNSLTFAKINSRTGETAKMYAGLIESNSKEIKELIEKPWEI